MNRRDVSRYRLCLLNRFVGLGVGLLNGRHVEIVASLLDGAVLELIVVWPKLDVEKLAVCVVSQDLSGGDGLVGRGAAGKPSVAASNQRQKQSSGVLVTVSWG